MADTQNIAETVVAKFGGMTGTARALSTDDKQFAVSTVQGWVERGRIPQDHWQRLMDAAKARDIELKVADFLPPGLVAA
jgi:hypothetical protein